MNLINHGGITKKIKGYLDRETSNEIILSSNEKEKEFANVSLIFGNSFDTRGYLENFKKIQTENKTFYYYNIVSVDKQKTTEYVALCENDRPLLLMSHSKNGNADVKYVEESFIIYDDEKKVDSRIKDSLIMLGNSAILDLNILDKKKDEYYKQEYKFYYDINTIVAFQIGSDKFFNPNDSRLDLAIKIVDYVSDKIDTKINENLEIDLDYVKEYHIKRKVK